MGSLLLRPASTRSARGRLVLRQLTCRQMRLLENAAIEATTLRLPSQYRWFANGGTTSPLSPPLPSNPKTRQRKPARARQTALLLPPPIVLYQSNHILAVYKPPGWHSIPHNQVLKQKSIIGERRPTAEAVPSIESRDGGLLIDALEQQKCLLTYTKQQQWGGGSQRDFIRPLHRIDQPCSGVLLLGKTTKAASRIQTAWQKSEVVKIYYVVAQGTLPQRCVIGHTHDTTWHTLEGTMIRRSRPRLNGSRQPQGNVSKGWSVQMVALPPKEAQQPSLSLGSSSIPKQRLATSHARHRERICTLEYRVVDSKPPYGTSGENHSNSIMCLLQVRTRDGARHMIRALLASHGLVVMGDVRYGNNVSMSAPLPDQSVALHAYSVTLPDSLVLGDAKLSSSSTSQSSSLQRYFWAPIPTTWLPWFGWSQRDIDEWHESCRQLEGAATATGTP